MKQTPDTNPYTSAIHILLQISIFRLKKGQNSNILALTGFLKGDLKGSGCGLVVKSLTESHKEAVLLVNRCHVEVREEEGRAAINLAGFAT